MLGFMLTTSFLSMWISNTATTSMMIPIAQAVLIQLMKSDITRNQSHDDNGMNTEYYYIDLGPYYVLLNYIYFRGT